jgi:type IV pilus assembly protein PilB
VPEVLAKKYMVFPFKLQNGILVLAMSDPLNVYAVDEVKLVTQMDVQPAIACRGRHTLAIEVHYGKKSQPRRRRQTL